MELQTEVVEDKSTITAAPETMSHVAPENQAVTQEQASAQFSAIRAHIIRSANWFYWIAGLSLVNVGAAAFGINWKFAIGLGISEVLSEVATGITTESGMTTTVILLYAASLCVTGFFVACGWFARRPSYVAFIVGMALFALDTVIFVLASDWIGVAFHGLALFYLWRGLSITWQIKKLPG